MTFQQQWSTTLDEVRNFIEHKMAHCQKLDLYLMSEFTFYGEKRKKYKIFFSSHVLQILDEDLIEID